MKGAVVVAIGYLDPCHESRLARFTLQESGERFAIVVEGELAEVDEELGANFDGGEGPGGKGRSSSRDSIVDVLGGGDGGFPEGLEGGGIDAVVGFAGGAGLAVDDVGEGGPIYLSFEAIGKDMLLLRCAIYVYCIWMGHGRSTFRAVLEKPGRFVGFSPGHGILLLVLDFVSQKGRISQCPVDNGRGEGAASLPILWGIVGCVDVAVETRYRAEASFEICRNASRVRYPMTIIDIQTYYKLIEASHFSFETIQRFGTTIF